MVACWPDAVKRLLAALLLMAAASAPAAAPETPLAPLTIEEATSQEGYWGLGLSPSGRYLAALRGTDKTSMVVVLDLADPAAKPAVLSVPKANISSVTWASDDRLVIAARFWIGSREDIVDLDKVTDEGMAWVMRSFAMDRDGGNFKMLFADNYEAMRSISLAQVAARTKDGRHLLMPAWQNGRLDLLRVDVHSGESKRVAAGTSSTRLWFATSDAQPAFRIDLNAYGETASVYAPKHALPAPDGRIDWQEVQTIQLRTEDRHAPPEFFPLFPGPEANTYYVAARPDGADTTGIYLYDYVQRKYVKTLASEPGVDIDSVLVDEITRKYLGVQYAADRRVTRLADAHLQGHFDAARRYFGDEVDVELSGMGENVWLLYTEGPRDAGSWHVYRLKEKAIHEVGQWLPLDRRRLGSGRVLRYKARDGLEISGYLTVPPRYRTGDRPPLILLPHGGPEARDEFGFDHTVQLLATRGYQVFQPNFRGSSGFGRRFLESGHGQWGAAMQDDLTDAMEFLVKEGYAARDRACIVGFSYGGYAALAGATLTPDLYRCAISYAGISHLEKHLLHKKRVVSGDDYAWRYFKRMIGDPGADEDRLEARSPALLAGAVKIPILLIHGEDDGIVLIEQSRLMNKALRKAGKDVRFVELEGVSHRPFRKEWLEVYTPMLEFLEQHLPVNPATAPPSAP